MGPVDRRERLLAQLYSPVASASTGLSPHRREFRRTCSGLHEIGGMSKAASVLNRGDRVATVRCNPRFMIVSSDWTTRQVDQLPHADPVGDFLQFRAAGREEAAHHTIVAEMFHPVLPALGTEKPPTATAKMSASSSSRFSIHFSRF